MSKKRIVMGLSTIFVVLAIAGFVLFYSGEADDEPIRFAEAGSVWWSSAQGIIAPGKNIYEAQGVAVQSFDVSTGLASKNAVVQGNADVGVVSTMPLVIAASEREPVVILGSYMRSAYLLALVMKGREPDSLCQKGAAAIGFVKGTISESYLREYLRKHCGVERLESLAEDLVALRPSGIAPSFRAGSVQAVSIWEPIVSEIAGSAAELGDPDPAVLRDPDIYKNYAFLITSEEAWGKKRGEILKFVSAVNVASNFITNHPDEARQMIERFYGYPIGWLRPVWEEVDFAFNVDPRDISSALEGESALALDQGLITQVPEYSYMLRQLDKVKGEM